MNPNWAEENLQTIRTLMERSAVYRRALAPIMLFAGTLGIAAAVAGLLFHLDSMPAFGSLWLGTAAAAVIGAFLLARRQALKARETFWSPPTRRVAQALLPALFCGLCMSLVLVLVDDDDLLPLFVILCILFYGCSLHAAGFFMPRGMKLFAWGLIGSGLLLLIWAVQDPDAPAHTGHLLMGFFFGGLHLAYGAYLYLTEKGKNAA